MAIARKSDVSTQSSLSSTGIRRARNRHSANQKKLSTHREVARKAQQYRTTGTTLPTFSPPAVSAQQPQLPLMGASPARQFAGKGERQRHSTQKQEQSTQKLANIPVMPSAEAAPLWLLRLYKIHRHSAIVTFLLVAITLVVYGWTVYSQELWSQSYRRLQNLQRHERQLMTNNGVIKNQLAKEAEKEPAKLVLPTPARMIIVNPAPVTTNTPPNTVSPTPEIQQQTINPLAY